MLLIGPAGIGKTSICRILAKSLDIPICFIPLGGLDRHDI
jgi:ATP-dependent protease Clp ATPase subunit